MTWTQVVPVWVFAPAMARAYDEPLPPFELDLDCGGMFGPGDDVPFVVTLVERASRSPTVDVTVTVTAPGLGTTEVLNTTVTLSPRRELSIARDLGLPSNAPWGDYELDVVAVGGKATVSSGCAFVVES
jgi:hypothetical protein